jgi:hypothetical protein
VHARPLALRFPGAALPERPREHTRRRGVETSMTAGYPGDDRLRGWARGLARRAERALPFAVLAYVGAAATARVLAIGDALDANTAVAMMSLHDPDWWPFPFHWISILITDPGVYVGALLLAASLALPLGDRETLPRWRVRVLRALTLGAVAYSALRLSSSSTRVLPTLLGGVALLLATRHGRLPTWRVALGTWVLTSNIGWVARVIARWHEYDFHSCMPPPPTLETLAPACVAFQVSAALALWGDKPAPHRGLRRVAAIWALFSALDTGMEAAVGHGLTEREPWTAWVLTWSFVAQGVAGVTLLALAVSAYGSLRATLFRAELDSRMGSKAVTALMFAMAMLAPILARHPIPWDAGAVGFEALEGMTGVTSPMASPAQEDSWERPGAVLIVAPSGALHDAESGRPVSEFTSREYGLIMDQSATVSDFTRVALEMLGKGVSEVHWTLPVAFDERAVGAIPARYAIRGIAARQLVHANVSAFRASEYPWRTYVTPPDPWVHRVHEALQDRTRLSTLPDSHWEDGYQVVVHPYDAEASYLSTTPPSNHLPNPLLRLFRESAHTMGARLVPLLGGLLLAYLAFISSLARDLLRLRREHQNGEWQDTTRQLTVDAALPRFPPWISVEDARLSRMDGAPYRESCVARAATLKSVREHLSQRLPSMHLTGGVYVGAIVSFVAAVMLAAAR